jgi:hypothetical protein
LFKIKPKFFITFKTLAIFFFLVGNQKNDEIKKSMTFKTKFRFLELKKKTKRTSNLHRQIQNDKIRSISFQKNILESF